MNPNFRRPIPHPVTPQAQGLLGQFEPRPEATQPGSWRYDPMHPGAPGPAAGGDGPGGRPSFPGNARRGRERGSAKTRSWHGRWKGRVRARCGGVRKEHRRKI
jgi:hypothetical protein